RRFFIVVGGGATTRQYQAAASKVRGERVSNADLDWLGIHATRLNAQLVRTIFVDIADPRVIKHYEIILKIDKPIAIAAGWKPGWSTDYDAVTLCQDYGMRTVINMTNIDQLYTKDPNKFKDAKPLNRATWKEYRKMAGDRWIPGSNHPFDPIASKLADELGVTVKLVNGRDFKNIALALDGKKFNINAAVGNNK
ncbi:MAG: UMP kinase, partial [Candidatus Gottesmanbacteria bacterium]|nr:UMP kinase [Candidatus Gottesmanbacteria bacterium]